MIVRHCDDIPPCEVKNDGIKGLTVKFVITAEDGFPQNSFWILEFAPGGSADMHSHLEDHLLYVLEGECLCRTEDLGEETAKAGDVIHISSCELHYFKNTGKKPLKMISTMPVRKGATGRSVTPCPEK